MGVPMQSSNCWNQIGVWGKQTCPELDTVVHCQNCSVYEQAGRRLLERPTPEGYTAEWTTLLSKFRAPQDIDQTDTLPIKIFRLGEEWLAIPSCIVKEILLPQPVHTLPHRSNNILRGIVNVHGQLLLCISLHQLLGVNAKSKSQFNHAQTPDSLARQSRDQYLIVIEKHQELWTFEADKLDGLYHIPTQHLRNALADHSSETLKTFTQAIISWQDKNISYLDSDRLFQALQEQVLL